MVFQPLERFAVDLPKISYAEWILQNFRKLAAEGKTALVWADTGTTISYADLLRDSVRVAAGLKAMGVKSGDTIGIVTRNSPEVFSFIIGCFFADIKIAPSIAELSAAELRSDFQTTKPRYILTRPVKAPVVQEAISDLSPRPEIILLDEKTFTGILAKGSDADPATFQPAKVDPVTHVFAYLFSSGTSGKQKAIMMNDYYFLKSGCSIESPVSARGGLLLCASQPNWVSWLYVLTRCTVAGRPWLFTTANDSDSILQFIHTYKPTTYICLPSLIYTIRHAVEKHPGRWEISSLKEILTVGDLLGAGVQKEISELLKIRIYQEYGTTEIGLITAPDVKNDSVYGSSGKLTFPMKLVNPDTEEEITEKNKVGEIRIKPGVMTGYLGNPEETAQAFDKDGWCKSGDLGYLDDEDNLFIVDRIKEMLKYKGFQVAPSELEDIIKLIPGVAEAGIAGKNDKIVGSLITAFVVKKPGANLTEDDINNFIAKKNLHDSKQLRGGVRFVEELPKNANGKLQRRKLAEILNDTPVTNKHRLPKEICD